MMNSRREFVAIFSFFLLLAIFEFQENVYARDEEERIGTISQKISAHKNCNDGQASRIERASVVAKSSIVAGLREVRPNSPIYKTWFGDWEHSNHDLVRARLLTAKDDWNDYEFRCGGHDNCVEFNAVTQHYSFILSDRLYVCHKWHRFPPLSVEANSRAGVMVHEIAHFPKQIVRIIDVRDRSSCGVDSNGKTNTCYGARNARQLALDPTCQTEPATCKASINAQNYQHFVSDALVNYMLVSIGL